MPSTFFFHQVLAQLPENRCELTDLTDLLLGKNLTKGAVESLWFFITETSNIEFSFNLNDLLMDLGHLELEEEEEME